MHFRQIGLGCALVASALTIVSCHPSPQAHAVVSDRAQDPGAVPTAARSFEMLGQADPVMRRGLFQQVLTTAGERCATVTEAVLKGGFDGTDLWRVVCSDSGEWLVSFTDTAEPSATSCKKSPEECRSAWRSVAGPA